MLNILKNGFVFACLFAPVILMAQTLSAPSRTLQVPSSSDAGAVPVWSRGYLFHLAAEDGSIQVYSTKDSGYQTAAQARISPEGATKILINDAAAAPGGTVFAAGGTTLAPNGAPTGFLSLFGPNRTPLLVPLAGTGVFRLVFADDGTLWMLARQFSSDLKDVSDYNTLRHYDANGKLLGSAVPRSMFLEAVPLPKPPMYVPTLSASHDAIGVYFDKAAMWIELGYDGAVKGQWRVPELKLAEGERPRYPMVYLTGSNQIVRVSPIVGKKPSNRIESLQRSGTELTPTSVDFSALTPFHPFFLGVDGDEQIVSIEDAYKLHWSKLEK